MRQKIKKMLALIAVLSIGLPASAHDFEVDGLYYNIILNGTQTVEVTFQGGSYSEYSGEYTGDVVIPESVTYDGVTYSVVKINNEAFKGCSGLTSVSIGNSVTDIAFWAFVGCTNLSNVTIGNSVTSIGMAVFESCPNLMSIIVDEGNNTYDSRENCNAIIETGSNTLIKGCLSTVIPNSVVSIGDTSFSGLSTLTSIAIPNSVTSIETAAFSDCSGLTSLTIGNSVTSIDNAAFYGCSGLTSVILPDSVASIGDNAFYGCTGLTSVAIPDSVTNIGADAFMLCI